MATKFSAKPHLEAMKELNPDGNEEAMRQVGDSQNSLWLSENGFPDEGSGYYSLKLGRSFYRGWFEMNLANYGYAEFHNYHVAMITCEIIAGLVVPYATTILAMLYTFFRFTYWMGLRYPTVRMILEPVMFCLQMIMPILAFFSCIIVIFNKPFPNDPTVHSTSFTLMDFLPLNQMFIN